MISNFKIQKTLFLLSLAFSSLAYGGTSLPCTTREDITHDGVTNSVCTVFSGSKVGNSFQFSCDNFATVTQFGVKSVVCTSSHCTNCVGCMPGESKVQLSNGEFVTMDQLELGDEVLASYDPVTGAPRYEPIVDITHRQAQKESLFVKITLESPSADDTENSSLLISADHLVFVAKDLKEVFQALKAEDSPIAFAGELKAGDLVWSGKSVSQIKSVEHLVPATGLFAPHTGSGTLVIFPNDLAGLSHSSAPQGMVISCYSKIKSIRVASLYFLIRRMLSIPQSIADQPERDASGFESWLLRTMEKATPSLMYEATSTIESES